MDLVLYDCLLRLMKVSLDTPIHLILSVNSGLKELFEVFLKDPSCKNGKARVTCSNLQNLI